MKSARFAEILHLLVKNDVIDVKQRSGRPKDLAVIPVLRATLDEVERRS